MRNLFRFILTSTILATMLLTPSLAFAQTASPTVQNARQTQRIANLKERADNEITRRINALAALEGRIGMMTRISATQKSTMTSEVQTEIANLNTLKAKIDADTDVATLQTDVKSIVVSYRVFVVFMPQISIIAASDRLLSVADQLTTLAGKLQTRITAAQSNGNNVSALTTALADMNAKIADAKTQANNAQSLVISLTPDGYPGNKAQLQSGRADIQTSRQDLITALKDAHTISQALTGFKSASPSASASH